MAKSGILKQLERKFANKNTFYLFILSLALFLVFTLIYLVYSFGLVEVNIIDKIFNFGYFLVFGKFAGLKTAENYLILEISRLLFIIAFLAFVLFEIFEKVYESISE